MQGLELVFEYVYKKEIKSKPTAIVDSRKQRFAWGSATPVRESYLFFFKMLYKDKL
jgi:hypothetical protein